METSKAPIRLVDLVGQLAEAAASEVGPDGQPILRFWMSVLGSYGPTATVAVTCVDGVAAEAREWSVGDRLEVRGRAELRHDGQDPGRSWVNLTAVAINKTGC